MKELRIQRGKWKGKKLSAPEPISGHANFTSSLVKKATFSILENRLKQLESSWEDVVWVDFFGGSGQLTIEAVGLGVKKAYCFELDQERFGKLLKIFKDLSQVRLFRKDATRYSGTFAIDNEDLCFIYLDPPYTYWTETPVRMNDMLLKVMSYLKNFKSKGTILCQLPDKANFPKAIDQWTKEIRTYGSHYLLQIDF